jgi:cyclomaltodextrinase
MQVYNSYDEFYENMKFGTGVEVTRFSRLCGRTDTCAFSNEDTLTLTVRVPRVCCAVSAVLKLYRDEDMSNHDIPAKLIDFGDSEDIFEVTLELGSICIDGISGLFYYTFGFDTPWGVLHVNCSSASNKFGSLTPDRSRVECGQILVYEKDFKTPERFRGGMMYHIFPDRFSRGKLSADLICSPGKHKILNHDWDNGIPQYAEIPGGFVENNMFFGGNLWGIAEQLDYIKSLGVNIIYLCPIFESASNHRYDTGDYMKIDSLLGGDEALDYLISEMKKRGMMLILDGVFNHTGIDSIYFNKFGHYDSIGAYNSKKSHYYKWYTFTEYPENYRCWWGVKILPEVKTDEPSFREFICGNNGVARHYLKKGIDGWRLDVADELSDEFLNDFRAAVKAENNEALILGEVWEDASNKISYNRRRHYFCGRQLDSVMNYPLRNAIIDFVLTKNSAKLIETARIIYTHYPKQVCYILMNFLGTHDTERIITVLAAVGACNFTNAQLSVYKLPDECRRAAIKRLKIAWALLVAFPGIPCIYNGDEIGMEGGRDPFNRMPFKQNGDKALTDYYKKIGEIRRREEAFTDGKLEFIDTGVASQLLIKRQHKDKIIIVAANLSDSDWNLEFEAPPIKLIGQGKCSKTVCLEPDCVEYYKF